MPTYEYSCQDCSPEKLFEVFHGILEQPSITCPSCNSTQTTKHISGGAGIHFKGSGFYVTDYKNKPQSKKPDNPKKNTKEQQTSSKTNKNEKG